MPITISNALRSSLPSEQRNDLDDFLWTRSGGRCHLCEDTLNRSSDQIVADHEIPLAEGGQNDRGNLKLAHRECNGAKRNMPTVDMRPFLKLKSFLRRNGYAVKYGNAVSHFGIVPVASALHDSGDSITLELPDGSVRTAPVLTESRDDRTYRFAFIDVPRSALFNDEECQPRTIKLAHVMSIFLDLQQNPLHEPPSCRIESAGGPEMVRLLMFDGQHKTIASWMNHRDRVVVKIYLDITAHDAIVLVNSIQAKIKKLPLSAFELSAKLADEWQGRLATYEAEVGHDSASERGFVAWLPPNDRTRGKQALKAGLIKDLLSDETLSFRRHIQLAGTERNTALIAETLFKNKVMERLLHLDALPQPADESAVLRSREHNNIVRVLNILDEMAFDLPDTASEAEIERRRRMSYQSSLGYIATLLRKAFGYIMAVDSPNEFLEKDPDNDKWEKVRAAVRRLVDHPVWVADFDSSPKMQVVKQALQTNQDAVRAFGDVQLKTGVVVGADHLDASALL